MASSTSTTAAEGRHLTTADIVAIQKERAFRLGELGFQINFPEFQEVVNAQHASKATNGQPVDSGLLAQDDHAVNAAIQKTCNALIQLQKYEKLLKENKPLVENAESEIDAILLAAGKSKRYLAEQDLRKKVNEAIKLRSPIPAPNYFTVFISDPSVGIGIKEDDMLAVNLPLQTSLDEVYMLLNYIVRAEVLARCNTTGEDPQAVANDEVVWKYELLSKDLSTTLENKPAMLKAARDLERMKRAVAEGCIAVLARENLKVPDVSATIIDEEEMYDDEVFDDDGQPYFEPLNWEMLNKKYAGELAASMEQEGENESPVSNPR